MVYSIEKNTGDTLYREFFYPCKTLELYSKAGKTRKFVEYAEATDYGSDIHKVTENPNIAAHNVVRRLLSEHNRDFFFEETEDSNATPILIEGKYYWIKYEDLTETWPNHYRTKTKKPLIGFKAVNLDGSSVLPSKGKNCSYQVGETYSIDEATMLADTSGFYFSPQLDKALSYGLSDKKVLLVVASGLVFIKNSWDDLAAQTLTIVREISKEEIFLLNPTIHEPKACWNGENWISSDEDFYYEYLCQIGENM